MIIFLIPVFSAISIWIMLDSKGGIFYKQERIGLGQKPFDIFKFRTMRPASDKAGLLTVGDRDNRITKAGYFLRKYKLDELPQLWNVLLGDMSLVGPRPEVKKYVDLYDKNQLKVLDIRPGITDWASLHYFKESELLAQSSNPEKTYIEEIMPEKLELNLKYIENQSFTGDLNIIFKTILKIIN